jgi:hypothetical protein
LIFRVEQHLAPTVSFQHSIIYSSGSAGPCPRSRHSSPRKHTSQISSSHTLQSRIVSYNFC